MCSEISANSLGNPWCHSWRRKGRLQWEGLQKSFFALNERVKGWWMMRVDGTSGSNATHRTGWIRTGEISAWLIERSCELIPETKGSILEGKICYSYRGWCRWMNECDQRWRASIGRRLNSDEIVQIRRFRHVATAGDTADASPMCPSSSPESNTFASPANWFWRPLSRHLGGHASAQSVLVDSTQHRSSNCYIPLAAKRSYVPWVMRKCRRHRCRRCTACCITEFTKPTGIEL